MKKPGAFFCSLWYLKVLGGRVNSPLPVKSHPRAWARPIKNKSAPRRHYLFETVGTPGANQGKSDSYLSFFFLQLQEAVGFQSLEAGVVSRPPPLLACMRSEGLGTLPSSVSHFVTQLVSQRVSHSVSNLEPCVPACPLRCVAL